jgi:hypothetical protein
MAVPPNFYALAGTLESVSKLAIVFRELRLPVIGIPETIRLFN